MLLFATHDSFFVALRKELRSYPGIIRTYGNLCSRCQRTWLSEHLFHFCWPLAWLLTWRKELPSRNPATSLWLGLVAKEGRRPFQNLRPRQTDLTVCSEKPIADVIHIPAEYRQESSVCSFASNTHNSAHVLPVTGGSIRGGENSY